LAMCQKW